MFYLVVPCYNEEKRLDVKAFQRAIGPSLQVLFVDDGSSDETVSILKENFSSSPYAKVLALPINAGKAQAVRAGVLHLLTLPDSQKADWWGYWDADLSTRLEEVAHFDLYQKTFSPNSSLICGSRVYRLGSKIRRSALRHYLGRGFATLIAHLLKIEAYDTQCGAKLFRPALAEKIFQEPFISRWIFDVEILLRVGQNQVVEYPLAQWQDIPGSKIKIGREIFRVLRDIFLIRRKYLSSQ